MSDQENEITPSSKGSGRHKDKRPTKVLPPRAAKLSFKYENQDMETAVSAVLCGMSLKEAANTYNVSKAMLKEALSEEMDNEPQEDGCMTEEKSVDSDSGSQTMRDAVTSKLAEYQAEYERHMRETARKKVTDVVKDGVFSDEIEVTCGVCTGVLYRRKFFCPGLHCECILTEDQWVTPKQFSIMGGKASLKNWKNAIRIYNVSLRSFMEQGSLDFWDHQINCSGKCYHKTSGGPGKYQSKINCLERKTLGNIEALSETLTTRSKPITVEDNLNEDIPSFVPMVQNVSSSPAFNALKKTVGKDEDNQPVFPAPVQVKPEPDTTDDLPVNKHHNPILVEAPVLNISPITSGDIHQQRSLLLRNQGIQSQSSQSLTLSQPMPISKSQVNSIVSPNVTNSSTSNSSTVRYLIQNGVIRGQVKQIGQNQFVLQNTVTDHPPEILQVASSFPDIESIMKDSKKFWQGISDIGLLAEIFNEIKAKMRSIKHEIFNVGITSENAERMSLLISNLGLQTKVKYKLANHKVAAEAQNRKIQEEIQELQKKMEDNQRRQAELKRKSHCFDQLLKKRPRHERKSTDQPVITLSDDSQENVSSAGILALGVIKQEDCDSGDSDAMETESTGSRKRKIETQRTESDDEDENESVDKNKSETSKSETENSSGKTQKMNGNVREITIELVQESGDDGEKLNVEDNSDPSDYVPSNDPSDSESDSLSS